jgi:hypothetical protein
VSEEHRIGIGLTAGGTSLGFFAYILQNVDAINGVLHGIMLVIALGITLLGLKKTMSVTVDKAVTLKFEPHELNVTLKAIEELPFKLAHPLLEKITAQVKAQLAPKLPEVPSVE